MSTGTTCRTCQRAVLPEHVDRDGNCCFCEQPKPAKASKAEKDAEK